MQEGNGEAGKKEKNRKNRKNKMELTTFLQYVNLFPKADNDVEEISLSAFFYASNEQNLRECAKSALLVQFVRQGGTHETYTERTGKIIAAYGRQSIVNFNGSITSTQMSITYSITMVIWVAIGGRGTLIGAFLKILY